MGRNRTVSIRSNTIFATYKTRPALRYNSSFRCSPSPRITPHSGIFTAIGAITSVSSIFKSNRNYFDDLYRNLTTLAMKYSITASYINIRISRICTSLFEFRNFEAPYFKQKFFFSSNISSLI